MESPLISIEASAKHPAMTFEDISDLNDWKNEQHKFWDRFRVNPVNDKYGAIRPYNQASETIVNAINHYNSKPNDENAHNHLQGQVNRAVQSSPILTGSPASKVIDTLIEAGRINSAYGFAAYFSNTPIPGNHALEPDFITGMFYAINFKGDSPPFDDAYGDSFAEMLQGWTEQLRDLRGDYQGHNETFDKKNEEIDKWHTERDSTWSEWIKTHQRKYKKEMIERREQHDELVTLFTDRMASKEAREY